MVNKPVFADTNLFLRYLTNDVPEQADHIEKLFKQAAAGDLVLITNSMVFAEIIWTLESFYGLSKLRIRNNVLSILNTRGLEVVDKELIVEALYLYSNKNVAFIDGFNAAWMKQNEISSVYTFDQKHFSRFEEIRVMVPGETPRKWTRDDLYDV